MPTEGRHTGEANAIFNDPEDFTIRKILSFGLPEIGGLRIKATSHHGVAAPVVTVTNGAMVGEMQTRLTKSFGRRGNRIFGGTRVLRPRKAALIARNCGFESGRCSARAEAMVEDRSSGRSEQAGSGDENQ